MENHGQEAVYHYDIDSEKEEIMEVVKEVDDGLDCAADSTTERSLVFGNPKKTWDPPRKDEDTGTEVKNKMEKTGENISFFVGRKHSEDSVKPPLENPCSINDDFDEVQDEDASQRDLYEAQSQVNDNKEKAKPEEIIGDSGAQVQNILGKFGGDINKALYNRRKHMETYVKDSIKSSNQKLEQIPEMNAQERKKFNREFSKQYMTTIQQWDMIIQKIDEEQEKLADTFQKQQKAFALSKSDLNQALQTIKDLQEEFIQSLENLEERSFELLTKTKSEVKKVISKFKRELMKKTLKYCSSSKTSYRWKHG